LLHASGFAEEKRRHFDKGIDSRMIIRGAQSELKAEILLDKWGVPDIVKYRARLYSDVSNDLISLELVAAIIKIESGGDPGAVRYEKNYKWLHRPEDFAGPNCNLATEKELQKYSYGLMQVMGAVARENGIAAGAAACPTKALPSFLFDPKPNLLIGLKHLDTLRRRWDIQDQDALISAYNQGSPRRSLITGKFKNQKYVDKVLKEMRKFTEWTS